MSLPQTQTRTQSEQYPSYESYEQLTEHQRRSMHSYIVDLLDTINILEAKEQKHLEIETDQHEQIIDLQQRLENLEHRHTEQYLKYSGTFEWMCKLFRNKTIPAACKLVLWYFYMTTIMLRPNPTGEELRIGVEETARAIGMSTSTVRKATDKTQAKDLLKRRYEPYTTENGDKITLVHITLNDVVATPEEIEMENEHGGTRVRKCHTPGCESTDVDRFTNQYCRECGSTEWYRQLGTRADADEEAVKKSIAEEYAQRHHWTQKQDASDSHLPGQGEQLATQPYPTRMRQVEMVRNIPVCHAVWLLNEQGEPAKAMVHGHPEKVVSTRECGSTSWIWSEQDHARVCAECWTPQKGS